MHLWYTEEKPSRILASEPTRKLESKLSLRYPTANNHDKRHSNSGGRGSGDDPGRSFHGQQHAGR